VPLHISECYADYLDKIPRILAATNKLIEQNRLDIKVYDDVVDRFPRVPQVPRDGKKEGWTKEMADDVENRWNAYKDRDKLIDTEKRRSLLPVYKICLRTMNCLPQQIISTRYGLKYQPTVDQKGKEVLVWTDQFCKTMCSLLVHPLWENNPRLLSVAIQYTVVSANDDRRDWLRDLGDHHDWFLTDVVQIARLNRAGRSMVKIRDEVLKSRSRIPRDADEDWLVPREPDAGPEWNRRRSPESPWYQLFRNIDRHYGHPEPMSNPRDSYRDPQPMGEDVPDMKEKPLLVNYKHIDTLTKALDDIRPLGYPAFADCEVLGRAVRFKLKDGYPKETELKELMDYAELRERELCAYVEWKQSATWGAITASMRKALPARL